MDTTKEKIRKFLATQSLCVISTVSTDGVPASAVVAFSETPMLELVFGTFNTTHKYKNLQENTHVSVVIGWAKVTLQCRGIARELSGAEALQARAQHAAKNPMSERFNGDERQRFFKVTPSWMRITDFTSTPEAIEEVTP